ncbi:mannosyltransferase family protein [Actinoplanes subglobosus]|uniref:Mannosyltransferase family protein n=1 Tax=Actinoplanes subglobosus TaxID=1547892 RepID=A0ABV8J0R5_9ACTN
MDTLTLAPSPVRAPEPTEAVPLHRPWRTAAVTGLSVWAVLTVLHLAVSAVVRLPHEGAETPGLWSILLAWNNWDAGHYVRIAEEGYHVGPGFPAFFPLYPILIRVFDVIVPGGPLISALVVANLAAWGALVMLHRLADHEFGPRVAQRATWYLAAFPMGFFLFIGYNESLFLLLAIAALYAGRRGHWWLAGTMGALSSATRLFGVLLMLPLAVEYLRQIGWRPRGLRPDVLGIAMVPLGVVAYSVYCLIDLGSPLAFSIAQDQWGRQYTFPGGAVVTAIQQGARHGLLHPAALGAIVDVGTTLAAVALLVLCVKGRFRFRRDQMYLVAQGAITVLMLMSTEVGGRSMQSAARYSMEAVAIFLILARMGGRPWVDRAVVVTGVGLQAVLLLVFMSGTFLVA